MRSMSDTLARLARLQALQHEPAPSNAPLVELDGFGSNPGRLQARLHVPQTVAKHPALVVVLHGCTQTAATYDDGTGWSRLADDHGFVVLYPQQTRQNNPHTCFNWFVPGNIRRGAGEALSIRQMIDAVVKRHAIDETRIFITGLSAGGAMANVMLATYPEVFAAGAIIAGLPYGIAGTASEAFDRMRGHGLPDAARLQAILRAASSHQGPWPRISVWQGARDTTVVPANADAIVTQWQGVHSIDGAMARHEAGDGYTVTSWMDAKGHVAVEHVALADLAHGTPIDAADGYGKSGPYILDARLSSTMQMARAWGLIPSNERYGLRPRRTASLAKEPDNVHKDDGPKSIQHVIESALRSAGLMK
ncbi:esterase, PHB depolymerase family [Rhizobium sp. RU35A]|uniref:extracellular catalytic domain type 1 short-chain-length polyhydroxyalkanoate depolymerase n=1 Tax=Rhizobium sp. RU35A TaxID=1907414 RepID=UPI00095721BF|nr:PHB depolymerase family esterase [Rhizobium sp. RU35A]SIQ45349.1 esterase, PHB depolymerase family [Rhizobium sp. RU35A]